MTFRKPPVQPLDLSGVEHGLDLGRGLHRALDVRVSVRPSSCSLGVVSRKDLPHACGLVGRQAQLGAELGQDLVMVTADATRISWNQKGTVLDRACDGALNSTSRVACHRGRDE